MNAVAIDRQRDAHGRFLATKCPTCGGNLDKTKQILLDLLGGHRNEFLVRCRQVASQISDSRNGAPITIEDVRAKVPCPDYINPSVFGAVLNPLYWQKLGYVKAKRPEAHGRIIRQYIKRNTGAHG